MSNGIEENSHFSGREGYLECKLIRATGAKEEMVPDEMERARTTILGMLDLMAESGMASFKNRLSNTQGDMLLKMEI